MNFISFSFLALWLIVLIGRITIGANKQSRSYLNFLLVFSIIFYAWHTPWCTLILLSACLTTYGYSLLHRRGRQRWHLLAATTCLLAPLVVFKYFDFVASQLITEVDSAAFGFILPVGISFFTFQALSYVVDVHRGILPARTNFLDLALFISFFPQLVAGPIVKAKDFLYQIGRKRSLNADTFFYGTYLMMKGYFMKFVCADNLAVVVDRHWDKLTDPSTFSTSSLFIVIGFSFQIFYDFAGYTNIARGLGYQLGFRLPENFNSPYIAISFSDFWRRWHMSLSEWFRDYLYIPMGGNRKGLYRTMFNLLLVMTLCGLWHGAAWTFMVWGAIHGLYLVIERPLKGVIVSSRGYGITWFIVVQCGVLGAWVFFRSESLLEAIAILQNMFSSATFELQFKPYVKSVMLFALPAILMHAQCWFTERGILPRPKGLARGFAFGCMTYLTLTAYGSTTKFIYFQF